jgi:CheY-like chemotaxis protein
MGKLKFAPEDNTIREEKEPWIVLIADDEGTVHLVTEMVLKEFRFDDRPVKLISAFSGEQALEKLKEEPNIALILLDVVMESITAGLDIVNTIRGDQDNKEVRIILRTGQAGIAKISEIIRQYDINGYKKKEHLTHENLQNTVILALRAYKDLQVVKERCIEEVGNSTNT